MSVSKGRRGAAVLLLALVAAACGGDRGPVNGVAPPTSVVEAAAPPSTSSTTTRPCQPAPIEDRAATVLAVGINNATTAEAPVAASVAAMGLGGVLLLGSNIVDADQARALIAGLRQGSPRGLLVAVDEEGGRVSRLQPILGRTPSARVLGQRPVADIAAVAAGRGGVLRDLGFDLVLAPVVDADGGPAGGAVGDRAFAATPAEAGPRAVVHGRG